MAPFPPHKVHTVGVFFTNPMTAACAAVAACAADATTAPPEYGAGALGVTGAVGADVTGVHGTLAAVGAAGVVATCVHGTFPAAGATAVCWIGGFGAISCVPHAVQNPAPGTPGPCPCGQISGGAAVAILAS